MEYKKPLKLVVAPEKIKPFLHVYSIIVRFLDSHLDVPDGAVRAFFEMMTYEKMYEKTSEREKAQAGAKFAAESLEKRGYQFHWNDLEIENQSIPSDTTLVCFELILAFLSYCKDNRKAEKDEAIAFFYGCFEMEYKDRMLEKDKARFTPYKQAVFSGVLAMACGYKLTKEKKPTFKSIFLATRYAIRKHKE